MDKVNGETGLSADDYAQAMNLIGQNMYGALAQTMQGLHPAMRNNQMVIQGLAAFFSNILQQQAPDDEGLRQHMLDHFTSVVKTHLQQFNESVLA